jgi:uncharacterized protein YaaN involved in tellurite resistance
MSCQAGHLTPLNASVFSASERIIQDHFEKYQTGTAELKDIIQGVLHHPGFDVREVDTNMHERLMRCLKAASLSRSY